MKKTILFFIFISNIVLAQESLRPWLGIAIDKGQKGVLVKQALPDTPALKAGIQENDEVLSVDGKEVSEPAQLIKEIVSKGVGNEVEVLILRDKKKLTKKITLVAKPNMLDVTKKLLLNKKAPAFDNVVIRGLDKKKFTEKDLLNKVTIIEFWATWCSACNASFPRLNELAKKHAKSVRVLSVSGEEEFALRKFIDKKHPEDSPIIYLQSPDNKMAADYQVPAIPMFVLVDKKGKVVNISLGAGKIVDLVFEKALELAK